MSNFSVPQLIASSAGLNASGQTIFRQSQELANMDPSSQDFQQKKGQIVNSLNEAQAFVETLRNAIG